MTSRRACRFRNAAGAVTKPVRSRSGTGSGESLRNEGAPSDGPVFDPTDLPDVVTVTFPGCSSQDHSFGLFWLDGEAVYSQHRLSCGCSAVLVPFDELDNWQMWRGL